MLRMMKKINNILRAVFIGFIILYGIVKIFDIVPKKKEKGISRADSATSEFDELW